MSLFSTPLKQQLTFLSLPSGSSIKYVLVTEAVAQKKQPPLYFGRGQKHQFHGAISEEEATWARYHGQISGGEPVNRSYEDYKEKGKAAGFT